MRKRLSNSLAIGLLLILTVMSGPASADPLQRVTASAYGAELRGLVPIAPTPTVRSSFPPETSNERTDLLQIPLDPLAFSGTATVRAITARDSVLDAFVPRERLTVQSGTGPVPTKFNARGSSRVEGLAVVADGDIELPGEFQDTLEALVEVGAVEAEALISCVNERPVVVAGSRLIGPLSVLGIDLEVPVDNLVNQVVDVVALEGILELRRNVINQLPGGGVEVIGLQVRVLEDGVVVNAAQAQIDGGGVCGDLPECSDGIDNDGDGKIDAADPDCHTDGDANNPDSYDPNDDSEAGLLPRTGGANPALGASLLVLGGLMLLVDRKRRKPNSI